MAGHLESPSGYPEGIRLFNAGEFFACHDVLEEVWTDTLGPDRQFYQGLIHAAVSLFHFEEGNLGGARKMYDSTRRYLEPYSPQHLGLDLEGFLMAYQVCFQPLLDAGSTWPTSVALDPERIPQFRWITEPDNHV